MKNLKALALIALVTFSTAGVAQTKKIDATKSTIKWVGKKVTGQHSGTINFKDGALTFSAKKLSGGRFNVDMATIAVTDLKAGEGKEKLEGHLKADDFFGTEKYPTANLIFRKVTEKSAGVYTVEADLKIKEKTNEVTFDLVVKGNTATTKLTIDRTRYDIKYGSGSFFDNLGDKAISDDFDLTVSLQF
jgi:polyisoprenoid-binding protein YceI